VGSGLVLHVPGVAYGTSTRIGPGNFNKAGRIMSKRIRTLRPNGERPQQTQDRETGLGSIPLHEPTLFRNEEGYHISHMMCSKMIKFRREEGSVISWGHRNLPPTGNFYEPRERGERDTKLKEGAFSDVRFA
jgi:hypothetical protein